MKKQREEVAKKVLLGIAAVGLVVVVMALPGLAGVLRLFQPHDWRERQRLKRSLDGLLKKKAVRYYRRNNEDIIEITEKGRQMLLSYDFENITIFKPHKWDNVFRVVIFDIPERKARARRLLLFKLREMGFYQLQDSVLAFPYECRKEVEFIRNYLFIEPHVKYLLVKDIEDTGTIKKHFKLS